MQRNNESVGWSQKEAFWHGPCTVLYRRRALDLPLKQTKRPLQPVRSLTASRIGEVVQKNLHF